MSSLSLGLALSALTPAALMTLVAVRGRLLPADESPAATWSFFRRGAGLALAAALLTVLLQLLRQWRGAPLPVVEDLLLSPLSAWVALLVQFLGTVIGVFSSRYLQGEPGQGRYMGRLAGVLAGVHVLLLADQWLILILAWAWVGHALHGLLCFYPDRPFAQLAAHKKRVSDRLADLLLLAAAAGAWQATGSGKLSAALDQAAQQGAGPGLTLAAVALAAAVIVRTAHVPLQGWLLQVMEAPTPVSALLHAGVVNLGGFVLIRFAPLLEAVPAARALLVAFGLASALLAAFAMLTRISIKVRLAWSTVAQMGFMVLECGLGLYQMAALHLLGHSLYKAHHFLAASEVVAHTRQHMLSAAAPVRRASLLLAPLLSLAVVAAVQAALQAAPAGWAAVGGPGLHLALPQGLGHWPLWWSALLALAWAPLLWLSGGAGRSAGEQARALLSGGAMVAGLAALVALGHALPMGLEDQPDPLLGAVALAGMAVLYLGLASLQWQRGVWTAARRWTYAGYYVDDLVTRLACRLWPARWAAPAWAGTAAAWPAHRSSAPASASAA
ncbi:NADH-quinone oxidoreductase subunit L [Ideonella dechloratans]|uniref:Probable inorganic carbon transporter subunit DabB n=1 Tax=Ideonella dechloratans TaxID=36863 RepID=A0A643F863_IDEDE|nr:NADH-quinone oxidoreductase subunit L [Ideonella dechloratans]KAB0574840.1 NADH-quinone oxidoreductase subunit L [Ideonella dechloratans]UFU12493.1 NADH-quinone oxidoreductase subunit L [Ideonella dechloratans]